MLTPAQIAQIKAVNAPAGGAPAPSNAMTYEQAHAWVDAKPVQPPSHTFENIGKLAGPIGGAVGQVFDNPGAIKESFNQGVNQAKSGYQQVQSAKNPLELMEGAAAQGAGVVNAAFSPIAPALNAGVGPATGALADKISDIPAVQQFARGKGGDIAERAATDVGNLDTMAMAVAGGPKVGKAAVDVGAAAAKGVNDFAARVEAPKAPKPVVTPEAKALADHIDRQGKAYSAIEDEVRNTAAKYPKVMTALNNAEVVRGTKPIEVLSSYAKGEALPFLTKGKLQVDKATQFLSKKVGDLAKIKEQLVKSSPTKTPVENFQGRMNSIIDAQSWSTAKKLATKAEAQKITNPWKDIYPDGIANDELDSLKTEQTKESSTYNSKSPFSLDAHAVVGKAARQLVEGNAEHAPINELNKLLSSHYDAIKLLNAMRGYTPHGGALSKMVNNTLGEVGGLAAGMVVGHPFLGAMAGRAGAEAVTEIINNHFISNPLKRTLVNNMPGADPAVVQKALDYLEKTTPTAPEAPAPGATPESTPPVSSPNDSTQNGSVKQNPEAGFIANPIKKNAEIVQDTGQVADSIDRQLKASSDVFSEYTPEMLKEHGGLPGFLKYAQQNIALELKAEGHPDESSYVASLNVKDYPTWDAFKSELKKIEKPTPAPQGLEMKNGWKQTFDAALTEKDGAKVKELLPYVPDYYKARFEKEINAVTKTGQRGFIKNPLAPKPFAGFDDLTTKIVDDLKGRTTVSKQYLLDATNRPELKQPERDLIRNLLKDEPATINATDFANKVKTELLPLKRTGTGIGDFQDARYENISLPLELRGPIAAYTEHTYQSPIKTSAGGVHFNERENPNYFAHTRVEDLPRNNASSEFALDTLKGEPKAYMSPADMKEMGYHDSLEGGTTRRVIELQSDLFQKGRLEGEVPAIRQGGNGKWNVFDKSNEPIGPQFATEAEAKTFASKDTAKLEPYRNTWQERIIREEVKQAAKDGKTKLQFPTGETAMKIEGLGEGHVFSRVHGNDLHAGSVRPENLKTGMNIFDGRSEWIITDVLGDGKFTAVPKSRIGEAKVGTGEFEKRLAAAQDFTESFDISGNVDTQNPIYKFYEKEVGRYLTNKYGAKVVTDPQGVKWYEVNVPKEKAKLPIEAFGAGAIPLLANQQQKK